MGDCSTPNVCGPPASACCMGNGVCTDDDEPTCTGAGGHFFLDLSCGEVGVCGDEDFPFGDPTIHACCTSNGCFDLTGSQCQQAQGSQVLNKACHSELCPDTDPPDWWPVVWMTTMTSDACSSGGGIVLPGDCSDAEACAPPAPLGAAAGHRALHR